MMSGQDLQTDGETVKLAGGKAHGGAAVEVRGSGQRSVVHDGSGEADLVDEVSAGKGRRRRPFGGESHIRVG